MTERIDGASVQLRGLSKTYGDVIAVDQVDLAIAPGEFLSLLGPSGSGKTTTLGMIAGFVGASRGSILINGRDVVSLPAERRGVGVVFQNYALFPHMSVEDNVAFPLAMRKWPRHRIREAVTQALRLVKLEGYGSRRPRELSGGQQQRIAIARAVVFRPPLLLMDEPLGALDKKLRESLQVEIMHISRQLGTTVIYVTHDQEEALLMSDRIALLKDGRIEQVGTGEELYLRPRTRFVADFIGESTLLPAVVEDATTGRALAGEGWRSPAPASLTRPAGTPVWLMLRPESMRLRTADDTGPSVPENAVAGQLADAMYLGGTRKYLVQLPGGITATVRDSRTSRNGILPGAKVFLAWDPSEAHVIVD